MLALLHQIKQARTMLCAPLRARRYQMPGCWRADDKRKLE